MKAIDGFGCGARGLAGFDAWPVEGNDAKYKFKTFIRQHPYPIVFAVLERSQVEAIKAFEELGGYCVASAENHTNTVVGLYVLTNRLKGKGHKVRRLKKKKIIRRKKNVKRK